MLSLNAYNSLNITNQLVVLLTTIRMRLLHSTVYTEDLNRIALTKSFTLRENSFTIDLGNLEDSSADLFEIKNHNRLTNVCWIHNSNQGPFPVERGICTLLA